MSRHHLRDVSQAGRSNKTRLAATINTSSTKRRRHRFSPIPPLPNRNSYPNINFVHSLYVALVPGGKLV